MCMRPCGPVRGRRFSTASSRTSVSVNYWTDTFRCGGMQVGGNACVLLGVRQLATLKNIVATGGAKDENIKASSPALYEKILTECYKSLFREMAEDAYSAYDFSDPMFRGWSHDRKIRYIMSTCDPSYDIRKDFSIGFEISSGFIAQ